MYVLLCAITGVLKAEQIWGEAEVTSSITAPLRIVDDATASGGKYITVAPGNNSSGNPPATGVAKYRIRVKEGGVYTMYLRVRSSATGDDDDSCWVRIQGATLNITVAANGWMNNNNLDYETTNAAQWFWSQVRHYADYPGNDFVEMTMAPGTYTVEIAYREDGLFIDGFLITNDPDVDRTALPDVIPFVPGDISSNPQPPNGASDVVTDVVLGWTSGEFADTHNVYIGTDFDDVNEATAANPLSVVLVERLGVNAYDPPGRLELGTTYYWRVDEVNAPPSTTIFKGNVWSFTTEPLYYTVKNVTVTASSPTAEGSGGPETIVDGSGLTNGLHGTTDATMWSGDYAAGETFWLQFDFDGVYKLYGMHVWNYNGLYEYALGFGFKDITIEYAVEPNEWMTLGDYALARSTSKNTYAGQLIDLDGIPARSIRINANSIQNPAAAQAGLSEVQFLYKPVKAREPKPADGETEVGISAGLSWRSGREAVSHQVHFGTDSNAVADGTALFDTVTTNACDLPMLSLETTYYWKIVEVNDAETPTSWTSDVWSFSTPVYNLVDGFESYTDDAGQEIFTTWEDGYNDNSNGSQVGYENPSYAEKSLVHSGSQSMPFEYGQNGATTSEATMTLAAAEDWTAGGATTLVVYFRGTIGNAAAQLYVKVNGTRIDYPGGTSGLSAPLWKQWNISLASLGNTAKSVRTVTIGVAGSGSGQLYFDDLRLYREAPPQPGPAVDPGTANLMALYAMEDSLSDGSGKGYNGTAEVGSSFGAGMTGYGKALVLDGTSGYATLPIGPLVQSLNSATFATWVNWAGSGSQWCRIFDFGSSTDVYMFLTPNSGSSSLRFAITTGSSGGESQLSRTGILSSGWHHVAVAIDGATRAMQMYLDGQLVASGTTNTLPSALGNTTQNYLGHSQWDDPYLPGSIDDFRIYNRALTEAEVRYLVGDR
jgi:hypothetical protein